ncbi:hypothetical protein CVT26_007314 [Gymnopilus dilepis]|uniref:Uncharacterized protein n=1 Tax=Gymnopilus dilepis TaxID=231916 RepID=A0A409W1L1_9AGAR|nr:hypothetical protein CVT26_007314 [Gymnopilus dilepis]
MSGQREEGCYYRSLLVGCFLSLFLFGLSTFQTLTYFRLHSSDPPKHKFFVRYVFSLRICATHIDRLAGSRNLVTSNRAEDKDAALICPISRVTELVHTCLTARVTYGVFVPHFGEDFDTMAYATSGVFRTGIVSVIITTLVQWFFAFRLYKLSRGQQSTSPVAATTIINPTLIPVLSASLSFARLVSYVGTAIYQALHHRETAAWGWCLFAVGILSILSDLLMAAGLFWCLWKRKETQKDLLEQTFLMPRFLEMNRVFVIGIAFCKAKNGFMMTKIR